MLLGDFSQFGKHPKLSYIKQGDLAKITFRLAASGFFSTKLPQVSNNALC